MLNSCLYMQAILTFVRKGVLQAMKRPFLSETLTFSPVSFFKAWYLALFELGIGAILSTGQKTLQRIPTKGSFREYAFLGLLFLAARVLTNLSVRLAQFFDVLAGC